MELSARNQLKGTIASIKLGGVMAEVVDIGGGNEVVSAITLVTSLAIERAADPPPSAPSPSFGVKRLA